jgi:ubiquinone/menaquinone biosynthesis C-methylase UbiE
MSYFSLSNRVPETSAVDPKALTWLYSTLSRLPMVRAAYCRFVAGALAQGVTMGVGLDLGTGPGYIAVEIARQRPGLRMVGLDLAFHMVERARRTAAPARLNGRGLWLQADGHSLPFADGSFDLVVSSFALHHWDEPLHVLNEIARVLRRPEEDKGLAGKGKSGGRYYIIDLCREVTLRQRIFAYLSIPVVSLPFGSYLGYGGYYESVRAGLSREEALTLLGKSSLPAGDVTINSTSLLPMMTLAPAATD